MFRCAWMDGTMSPPNNIMKSNIALKFIGGVRALGIKENRSCIQTTFLRRWRPFCPCLCIRIAPFRYIDAKHLKFESPLHRTRIWILNGHAPLGNKKVFRTDKLSIKKITPEESIFLIKSGPGLPHYNNLLVNNSQDGLIRNYKDSS